MNPIFIVLGVVFLLLLWFFGNYNGIVRVRNHVRESWSDIDTELKRRHDLIPNLVETVRGYAAHESKVLEATIEARNRAIADHRDKQALAQDEGKLVRTLGPLLALSEKYPDLKADQHFLNLQEELINTENRIQAARRFYNGNVRELNNRVQMFPSSVVASLMGQKAEDYFQLESLSERAVPDLDLA